MDYLELKVTFQCVAYKPFLVYNEFITRDYDKFIVTIHLFSVVNKLLLLKP